MAKSFETIPRGSSKNLLREMMTRIKALEDGGVNSRLGALIFASAALSVLSSVNTIFNTWDSVIYDDSNFWNVADPERLTVPLVDPPISRVQLYVQFSWQPDATVNTSRNLFLRKNGVGGVAGGIAQNKSNVDSASKPYSDTLYSMPVSAVAGDYFDMSFFQDSPGALFLVGLGFGIKSVG